MVIVVGGESTTLFLSVVKGISGDAVLSISSASELGIHDDDDVLDDTRTLFQSITVELSEDNVECVPEGP